MATPKKTDGGIQFLDQFMKYFITPYGPARPFPEDVSNKVKVQNCEIFKRPNVFMSEVARSVANNTDCLSFFQDKVQRKVNRHVEFEEFQKFDSKREGYAPNGKALKKLLEKVSTDEKAASIMRDMFLAGSELMVMSTNYLVLEYVLKNPDEIAKFIPSTFGQEVIDNPLTESVINVIVQKTVNCTPTKGSVKRRIFSTFDSDSSEAEIEEPTSQPSSSKKKTRKGRTISEL